MSNNMNEQHKVKLTLNKLNAVATWNYASENTDCKLCHKDLLVPVQEPGANKINGDVTIGMCMHGFHASCINLWVSKGNVSCPYCHNVWKVGKNVGSSVYVYKN